jgi:hypothetical protein
VFTLADERVLVPRLQPGRRQRHEVGQRPVSRRFPGKEGTSTLAKSLAGLSSVQAGCANVIGAVLAIVDEFLPDKPDTMMQGRNQSQPFVVHPTLWHWQCVAQQVRPDHHGRTRHEISPQERLKRPARAKSPSLGFGHRQRMAQ